jgi:NTE family protein
MFSMNSRPYFPVFLLFSMLSGGFQLIAAAQQPAPAPSSLAAFQHQPLPAVVPAGRPVNGIALEGGGALGLAHIGVLKWLEEHRIPIDRITGTSMGSLVGGLYAAGHSPDEMAKIASSDAFQHVFTLQSRYTDVNFRRRQDRSELPQAFAVGLAHGPQIRNALLNERGVNEFLFTHFFASNRADLDFNQTPIPFRCVATNLTTLHTVTFDHGSLASAVRASISIPGVFPPVQTSQGDYLVDGGILNNLPTEALRDDLHAERVIAVHLQDAALSGGDTASIVGVLNRAFSAGITRNVEASLQRADIVIEVPLGGHSGMDYDKARELIRIGYQAADAAAQKLLPLALSQEDWQSYLTARAARQLNKPVRIQQIQIAGGSPSEQQQVRADLRAISSQPPAPGPILRALRPIQSNNDLAAGYEFFTAPGNSAQDASLLVHLRKDPIGPPYLLVSPELAASTSNVNRAGLNLRLIDQNFTGYGSELRATARIGYRTDFAVEYYRLLTPGGFYLQPEIQAVRQPVYIWVEQKRIAERFQQTLAAGLEAGRTFSPHLQIAAEWKSFNTRWSLRSGDDGGGYLNGDAQDGLLHIRLDEATSGTISPNGYRFDASAGALYHAADSANAPLLHLSVGRTRSWRDVNIFGLSAEVNSTLRANVAQPYRFTLGGPLRLSASSFDEFRGTDTLLTRAGWLRRIAPFPLDLGQGLYTIVGYESGEIWSPENHAILRQNLVGGLVGNTPIGLITLGGSVGDAGHRKVFLTLGRIF